MKQASNSLVVVKVRSNKLIIIDLWYRAMLSLRTMYYKHDFFRQVDTISTFEYRTKMNL